DGNGDGLINVSDITPIGQHWGERLDGYRVYRKTPSDGDYVLLENPDDPGLPYTVPRSMGFPSGAEAADPRRPVVYSFTDTALAVPSGEYTYFVAPYDTQSGEEGTASDGVEADLDFGGYGESPPLAVLEADVEWGELPLTVNFSAEQSLDFDGEIEACIWDTDENPVFLEEDTFPDLTRQVVYTTAATHCQWVMIIDDDGFTTTTCAKVSVREPGGNQPPVASVVAEPNQGEAPLEVTWNATVSADHDGTIVKYEWDTDNDPSTFEVDTGATPTYQRTYPTGGLYTEYVRITDNGGLTDTASSNVLVLGDGLNPMARFTMDTEVGDAPLLVNFDASGSYAPNGTIVKYEWDYDSDSVVDDVFTIPTATHTYMTPGYYTASLTVTDDQGAMDDTLHYIEAKGWKPVLVDAGPYLGDSVSLAIINGTPAIAYSLDDWGHDMELRYIHCEDTFGEAWPDTPVIVHDGGAIHHVGTTVSLAEVVGRPAIGYHDATGIYMLYRRASDEAGAAWPPASYLVDTDAGDFCSLAMIDGCPALSYLHVGQDELRFARALDANGDAWDTPVTVNAASGSGRFTQLLAGGSMFSNAPLIAHYNSLNAQLLFERALDVAGASWAAPVAISGAGECTDSVALALINGLPALAYYGTGPFATPGLNYVRALDGTPAWGPTHQVVVGANNGLRPCLTQAESGPAVAYKMRNLTLQDQLAYQTSAENSGSTWHTCEYVDTTRNVGFSLSLVAFYSIAFIAYTDSDSGQLWCATLY
ncbi:PKD domain-containing protein, partial [bacterium]|nr:PKD domain-containing protein [bacterium]